MKVCESRKSKVQIMAHPGFGGIILKKGNVSMYVPPEHIFKSGKLKKYAINEFNELLKRAETNENKVG